MPYSDLPRQHVSHAWPPVAGRFGGKHGAKVKSVQRKWNCKSCGRQNENAAAPGEALKCEYCTETSSSRLDTRKREVVARLRARYGEARELVAGEQPYAASYGHLEWILGTRRNLDQDESAFAIGVSELVVLWLQDLALELDGPGLPPSARDAGESATSAAGSRQAAAQSLRAATHDFAEAFLSSRRDSM